MTWYLNISTYASKTGMAGEYDKWKLCFIVTMSQTVWYGKYERLKLRDTGIF